MDTKFHEIAGAEKYECSFKIYFLDHIVEHLDEVVPFFWIAKGPSVSAMATLCKKIRYLHSLAEMLQKS